MHQLKWTFVTVTDSRLVVSGMSGLALPANPLGYDTRQRTGADSTSIPQPSGGARVGGPLLSNMAWASVDEGVIRDVSRSPFPGSNAPVSLADLVSLYARVRDGITSPSFRYHNHTPLAIFYR